MITGTLWAMPASKFIIKAKFQPYGLALREITKLFRLFLDVRPGMGGERSDKVKVKPLQFQCQKAPARPRHMTAGHGENQDFPMSIAFVTAPELAGFLKPASISFFAASSLALLDWAPRIIARSRVFPEDAVMIRL